MFSVFSVYCGCTMNWARLIMYQGSWFLVALCTQLVSYESQLKYTKPYLFYLTFISCCLHTFWHVIPIHLFTFLMSLFSCYYLQIFLQTVVAAICNYALPTSIASSFLPISKHRYIVQQVHEIHSLTKYSCSFQNLDQAIYWLA